MITKTIYKFAYLPVKINSKIIWLCRYMEEYVYRSIDIIQCDTTCATERCGLEPGYYKWILIKKTLIKNKT